MTTVIMKRGPLADLVFTDKIEFRAIMRRDSLIDLHSVKTYTYDKATDTYTIDASEYYTDTSAVRDQKQ